MLNERLGKYLLLEKLPGNGPAESYLAKSSVAGGLNKFFIIKKVARTTTAKMEIPSLNHSNILAVFDSGIDRGFFYTVMDYFESCSLAQILTDFAAVRCQLGIDQCLYIVRETAAALIYAHNYTAHGRISTDAILIGLDGAVKVADFEYFTDIKTESPTDLRMLGRLLSELLGENRRASIELETLCTKALHLSPDRFASANELYREINRYLNTQYPEFSSPEFGEQLVKFYSGGVQHLRAKLREYANIDIPKAATFVTPVIDEPPEKSVTTITKVVATASLPEGFGELPKKGANPDVNFENLNRVNPFVAAPPALKRPPPRAPKVKTTISDDDKPSLLSDITLLVSVAILLTLIGYTYKITIKGYSKKMLDSVRLADAKARTTREKNNEEVNYSAGLISRMDATRQLSYVNIRVVGAPPDARLFINGKELLEKPPLKKYPIFASHHTLISVLSAKTRRSDARRIMLKPGEVSDVTLSLRPRGN